MAEQTNIPGVRKKFAIIDGKSVFYRGYYAMPNLSTKDGTPTGGVYGFCAMALELIKKLKPDYVCVAWDKPKTNIRKRLAVYPDYKAGRKPAPPDFYVQIPILHEVLEAFNWPLYELDDYEADDIMCGLAKKADKAGIETMLITSDLDALQCVGPHTHVYALKKGLTNIDKFDPESFEQKYGIKTDQFLDLKALKGDSSDNIPGVPGIGEKGAADLLREYKTLDGVYENIALIKNSIAKKLEAGKDSAYMSREVAQLYDDAPIELDLTEMDVNKLDVHKLAEILKRLEFRSLLRNLPDGMRVLGGTKNDERRTTEEPSVQAAHVLEHLPKAITVDEKTDVKLSGDIVMFARSGGKHGKDPKVVFLADEESCYIFDLGTTNDERRTKIVPILKTQFSKLTHVTGYDLKNQFQILLELGIDQLPAVAHDVHVGAFIINSLRRDLSLSALAAEDLGIDTDLDNLDDDQCIERASEIVAIIRELSQRQGEQVSELTDVIKLMEQVEWPIIPVLTRIETVGMKLDPKFYAKLSDQLADQISDVEQTIYGMAEQEFNISSPSQLSEVLFEKLGLPTAMITKKGKAGHFSTAVGVLQKLKGMHPIIEEIEKYREYTKLKSTYVDPLPTMLDENDRVHGSLNLTVTPTGRLSSIDPNLQNIPVRTELGREIRRGFIAEKGNVIISADYSQFELRIAAAMSGDEAMIESFNQDRDIHTETAALIQGVKPEEVTKEMRRAAKAVNFGILYGQGVHGLAEGTGISYADAKAFIEKYFEVRPKLKGMIEQFKKDAKEKGYVETIMGRRKPTPDVLSSNFVVREAAYRAAINMPIQGGAADLTKLAMVRVEKMLNERRTTNDEQRESELGTSENSHLRTHNSTWPQQIMQVHDSIMVECRTEDADEIAKEMQKIMENVKPDLGVKLKVDVSIGKNWGEL